MNIYRRNYLFAVKQSEKVKWEEALASQLKAHQINFEPQYRFHPSRLWRIDLAIPEKKISIEIQGGIFGRIVECHNCHFKVMRPLKDGRKVYVREGGRHNTGVGMENDCEKNNALIASGWRPLTFTSKHIQDGSAVALIVELMK